MPGGYWDAVKARRRHAADTEDAFETENENDEDESRDARAAEDGESGGSNPAASDPPAQTDLSPEDKKKVLLSVPATLVNAKRAVVGRADISRGWVHFVADEPPLSRGDAPPRRTPTGDSPEQKRFCGTTSRRRVHHAAASKVTRRGVYLSDGRSVFLAFLDKKTARDAASKIAASRADIALFDVEEEARGGEACAGTWRRGG